MRQNHMIGITPVITPNFQLLSDAGIRWMRSGGTFPWQDRVGQLRERLLADVQRTRELRQRGFSLLGSTMCPGSSRYNPEKKQTTWHPGLPEWFGPHDSDRYYELLEQACTEMGRQYADSIEYWQIANEPDIDIFRGPLSDEQIARFLLVSARGIKQGNPRAKTGINLGGPNDYARQLTKRIYGISDTPFDYVGLDGYFGSWQPGGPENWPAYIDEAFAMTGKPVIINEWGYSSLASGTITDDPPRRKPYNQDVCRDKRWKRVWRQEHSPQEQADYVRACLRIFADHPKVIGNFFFRYNDAATCWQCGQPDCPAECAWGMVDVDQNPKPAYFALKESVKELFG